MNKASDRVFFERDWDWYAIDLDGYIGHFTNAGLRPLPVSVRLDLEGTRTLEHYFYQEAPVAGSWHERPDLKSDVGEWKSPQHRERYMRSFGQMASKRLYSYDTELIHSDAARYYLVAIPSQPLVANDLPEAIRNIIFKTRAPLRLTETTYISGEQTETW